MIDDMDVDQTELRKVDVPLKWFDKALSEAVSNPRKLKDKLFAIRHVLSAVNTSFKFVKDSPPGQAPVDLNVLEMDYQAAAQHFAEKIEKFKNQWS